MVQRYLLKEYIILVDFEKVERVGKKTCNSLAQNNERSETKLFTKKSFLNINFQHRNTFYRKRKEIGLKKMMSKGMCRIFIVDTCN